MPNKVPTRTPIKGYSFYDWTRMKTRTFKTLNPAVVQASIYLKIVIGQDMAQNLMWGVESYPDVDLMKDGRYYGTIYLTRDLQTTYLLLNGGKTAYPIKEEGGVVLNGPINLATLSKLTGGYSEA